MQQPPVAKTAWAMMVAYFKDFGILRETRKDYWGIQIVNFLDCTFYFAMLTIGTLFLSHDLGLTDKEAGRVFTIFTAAVTILLTFSGMICDWLGIRKALRLSLWSMLILRAAMVVVGLMPALPHRGLVAMALLALMAPATAGIQTIFQAATQRFTTKKSRSAGFNLWYLIMNIGAMLGGAAVDVVRLGLKVPNAHIFTMGAILAVLSLIVGETLVRKEEQLRGPDEGPESAEDKPVRKKPLEILRDVFHEPALFRLIVLIALILGVRAVYVYLYMLMPKYWERTIGPDAAIGVLNMINPFGIIAGLILFIPLANKFKVFNLLVFGAMVSALSLFPMALPWQIYGMGIAKAHYLMAILCMIILTVGEVLWSPKLYEYTAAIAPKGQEGTYLGLSMIPWFLAKSIVSWFSGDWLTRWCPEKVMVNGATVPLQQAMIQNQLPYWQTPAAMWLILGVYALVGCLIAAWLRGWLTKGAQWKSEPRPPA
jgi:MFS family permease